MNPPKTIDKIGKELWRKLEPEIAPLTNGQACCLEVLCKSYSLFRVADQHLQEHGFLAEGSNGLYKPSPALAAHRQAYEQVLKMAKELGISQQIKTAVADEVDELDEIFEE